MAIISPDTREVTAESPRRFFAADHLPCVDDHAIRDPVRRLLQMTGLTRPEVAV